MTENRNTDSEQVEVMLLGTFHMDEVWLANTGVENDDMLAADRQTELRDLTDRLESWNPDKVAVERPYGEVDVMNDIYEKYRAGEYAYDREETFPSWDPARDEPESECRSEVVQIGFRLADRLRHDQVLPIDEDPERLDTDPFADRTIDSTRKVSVSIPGPEELGEKQIKQISSMTITECHEQMNENELRNTPDLMFDRAIRVTGEQVGDVKIGSPVDVAYWYDRNLRTIHHLWRTMEATDDRVLHLTGTGRILMLWHLLNQAPMFCSVSPLSILKRNAE